MNQLMYDIYAYAFTSTLSLSEIRAKLNDIGPWSWIERDNDRFGEYISTRAMPDPDPGFIKIFVEPDHYAVNVVLKSERVDAPEEFAIVRNTLMQKLLPAIDARNIRDTGTYE